MGTLQAESETKRELDDSGCVQDETPCKKNISVENGHYARVHLLDLSDDVLLYILKHCSPKDLKALGYTCERLGNLICDHTLWQDVDARAQPCGRARLRWFLTHVFNSGTREILLSGYSREARGCLGHVSHTRKEAEEDMERQGKRQNKNGESSSSRSDAGGSTDRENERLPQNDQSNGNSSQFSRQHAPLCRLRTGMLNLARISGSPTWSEHLDIPDSQEVDPETCALSDGSCPGPQFTLTQPMLQQLKTQCPRLTSLSLEYCNINCITTGLSHFPTTLKKLSLRGARCYNLPLDKSFLFNIQDYLPDLESLDVSECEWMEPASLLPLSKMPNLRYLHMQHCYRMSEFVAYASLATRYGFRKLEYLDVRGSPFGDSEVSALGWLPELRELYMSPAPEIPPWPTEHSHYKDEALPTYMELDSWEREEPDYFKTKQNPAAMTRDLVSDSILEDTKKNTIKYDSMHARDASTYNLLRLRGPLRPSWFQNFNQEESHRIENGSGDHSDNTVEDEPGPSVKRRRSNEKSSQNEDNKNEKSSDTDTSDEEDSVPLKRLCKKSINDGASTSKSPNKEQKSNQQDPTSEPNQKSQKYVCFRRNENPVPVECPIPDREEIPNDQQNELADHRHHILYVNVAPQLHAVYRLSIENEQAVCRIIRRRGLPSRRIRPRESIFYSSRTPHLDATSLVSDTSIRRFGRADGQNINYVQIGPNGIFPVQPGDQGGRPDRSNLRVLSITGFRHITDQSLEHLATAAPHLTLIDFSETQVTSQGVDNFKSLRPDCEVRYSPYIDNNDVEE